jgi:hypothetical protein
MATANPKFKLKKLGSGERSDLAKLWEQMVARMTPLAKARRTSEDGMRC